MNRVTPAILFLLFLAPPTAACAHVGIDPTSGFVAGFMHPIGGMDHILTMVAVGLFATRLGGRAMWLLPLTFVLTMTLAGVLGMAGVKMPFAEIWIALSVVVLGLTIALQLSIPTIVAVVLVGFFAIFHGHVHGAEMPANVSGYAFGVGFACATAILHAMGIGLGLGIGTANLPLKQRFVQLSGGAMSAAGIVLLSSLL